MKHSSYNDTVLHENSPTCHVREHILDDPMADCAIANLNGRYPESGWVLIRTKLITRSHQVDHLTPIKRVAIL